ncbi:MAG: response regulator [Verrucomicrobia bacterium]|nr:response regulator [Verrucomicrobiota bacterium]
MDEQHPSDITGAISLLYELALSTGHSLDLEANCDRFIRTLLARKNLAFGSVWLTVEALDDVNTGDTKPGDVQLAYANPHFRIRETRLPADHPLLRKLAGEEFFSATAGEPGFEDLVTEKGITGGVFAVYSLGTIGFLKLYSLTRRTAFPRVELNSLRQVIAKFAVSLEGCLAHRQLARKIEERDHAEGERRRLAMVVEQMADSVIITDTHGTIQYVNPAFEHWTGYSAGETAGLTPRLLKSGRHPPAFYEAMWKTLLAGETWRGQIVNRLKNGNLATCDTVIVPARDEKGAPTGFVAVLRDITRLLEVEEQYAHAQKMESIGRLTGGIAHDFNNTLTAVLGFSSLLLEKTGEDDPDRQNLEQIMMAGERAANLTRQLLTFSHPPLAEMRVLDLNALVVNACHLLRRSLGEDVDLVTLLDEHAGNVRADASLLNQIVMNLALNARDAMPRGGQLTIRTAPAELDQDFCARQGGLAPGSYVLLGVRDTGTGMSEEVRRRAFEPFFTTKSDGKGTGLGLSVVYGIAHRLGGCVELESRPEAGTEARFWLPRVEGRGDTLPVELEGKVVGGRETLLLVEDEAMVRDLATQLLRSLGYSVLEAGGGEEALALLRSYRDRLDLVLTDVVMPQMDGVELTLRMRQERPELKVLYMSGFADNAFAERGLILDPRQLIRKPFTRETLARKIREVLDAPEA